ncbi:hypothetical protein [Asanoa siamensis]|uniref:Uncharacterized protein n=1 Tax=Asanoa siamensis TaxID=926357 RepID=A0ABQ4CRW1_9ACTN|nr:hypothetical protein [Asanoa siamensis]GIF74019.1 hypothetical protein Asi02nite_35370 [Asanoa siamensis]
METRPVGSGVETRWRVSGVEYRVFTVAVGDASYAVHVMTGSDEAFRKALPAFVLARDSLASLA